MDSWFVALVVGPLIATGISFTFWVLFQRRIEARDQEVANLRGEVKDLREERMTALETRFGDKIEVLEKRLHGEVESRRELDQTVSNEYVHSRDFRRVEERLGQIDKKLDEQGKEITMLSTMLEPIVQNISIVFGKEHRKS